MEIREIKTRLEKALATLLERDGLLLEYDAGEQTIVFRLGLYMVPDFPNHDIDVEYNRHGVDTKMLDLPPECRRGGNRRVFPDLIVHRRGNDTENLLVMEIKKETNREDRARDRAKVRGMKVQLGYRHGALVEIPAGPGAGLRKARIEWV